MEQPAIKREEDCAKQDFTGRCVSCDYGTEVRVESSGAWA